MFSGSESTESQGSSTQKYTQWALNPSAYQNVQTEQVDWAALAHQWIKMKEAGPPHPTPQPPAAPIISRQRSRTPAASAEGGEAPMEMELENDSDQWQDWGWNSTNDTNPWPPAMQTASKQPLLPTPSSGYSTFPSGSKEDYNSCGYWSGPNGKPSTAKVVKPHNKRYSKVNIPITCNKSATQPAQALTPPLPPVLDANKRKQLPAWIREGLEKMERDKMKQIDRSRDREQQDDVEEKRKLRENALEILKSSVKLDQTMQSISTYDDSNDEEDVADDVNRNGEEKSTISVPSAPLTPEEQLLRVRKIMTDVLLKVTDREIAKICKEELQRHLRRTKATDQQVTAPSEGANLSARLGLGAYDDTSDASDDEDDKDEEDTVHERTTEESDNELRETIRRRREKFALVEQEIEARLAVKSTEKPQKPKSSPTRVTSSPEKTQARRSSSSSKQTCKQRKKRRSRSVSRSRSRSRSSSASSTSPSRRNRRRSRSHRKRSRKYSRSRSRSRSRSTYRRRFARRSRTRSPRRRRRRSRSTRSKSRSYDSGRGKRSHRH